MSFASPSTPPRIAIALMSRLVPDDEREPIIGDLTETYADRVASGRRFNGLWFWTQTLLFAVIGSRQSAVLEPRGRMTLNLGTHLRQAARRLSIEWRFTLAIVAILAIGIGPASTMLSVLNNVLLKPLPYANPERLALVRIQLGQVKNHPGLAMDEINDFRAMPDIFAGVEGEGRAADSSLGPPDRLEPVTSIQMTTGMLPMLGVAPVYGRQFVESDVADGKVPPVMLDYGYWRARFGGSPAVLGTNIIVDGRSAEIVGVLPEGFTLTTGRAVPQPFNLYRPLRLRPSRNFWGFPTLVRLKDGVTIAQANARLDALARSLLKQYPKEYSDAAIAFAVHPLLDDMVKDTRPALRAAMGGVLLLLLIAVGNATALVIARLKTRDRDFALRGALGASRGALVLDVLAESALLGLLGGLAGSVFAAAGVAGVRRIIPHTVPRWHEIAIGWDLLLFSAGFALLGLVLLGLLPVWKVSRGTPYQALREGALQGGRAEGARSRLVLVGGQIALTVVLAFGAVQLVRSAVRLAHVNLGFDPNVLTVRVPIAPQRFRNMAEIVGVYQRVRDRIAAVNGVESVGAVSHLPFSGTALLDSYSRDFSREPGWDHPVANYYCIQPGYFAAVKIPILYGRDITDLENSTEQHVIVIDDSLARNAFPELQLQNVIGQRLNVGYQIGPSTIVGIVGHARGIEVGRNVRPQLYAPMGVFLRIPLNFTIRAHGDAMALRTPIRAAVEEVGPGGALSGFTMLTDNVTNASSTLHAVTGFVTTLAICAGLLSTVGLYIVIAFVVHQRRRSTAIRSALGASPGQLIRHHLRTSATVIALALPVGIALAILAAPLFSALVYGVKPRDVTSLSIAAVMAIVAGLLGTYMPARRAGSADVVVALRGD
jgi:putative ABC transport system permease protein